MMKWLHPVPHPSYPLIMVSTRLQASPITRPEPPPHTLPRLYIRRHYAAQQLSRPTASASVSPPFHLIFIQTSLAELSLPHSGSSPGQTLELVLRLHPHAVTFQYDFHRFNLIKTNQLKCSDSQGNQELSSLLALV